MRRKIMESVHVLCLIGMLVIVSGCSHIRRDRIKDLSSREYENFTLYYMNPDCMQHIEDYDAIIDNMVVFMKQRYRFDFEKPELNIVILPLENDVVNFQKQGSSACTDYRNIYLLDFKNLENEIYLQHGEPPEEIYIESFVHELGHVFTHNRIQYKKSNRFRPEEMHSVFLTYINFKNGATRYTQILLNDIFIWYNQERMKKMHEEGLACLKDASDERSVAVFLYYLYDAGEDDRFFMFLESDHLSDFIQDAGWSRNDDLKWIEWIENMKNKTDQLTQ